MAYHLVTQGRGLLHSFVTRFFFILSVVLIPSFIAARLDFVFANTFYGLF